MDWNLQGSDGGWVEPAIIRVQIERSGVMEMAAYDNFYSGSVVTGPRPGRAWLEELRNSEVLGDFTAAPIR